MFMIICRGKNEALTMIRQPKFAYTFPVYMHLFGVMIQAIGVFTALGSMVIYGLDDDTLSNFLMFAGMSVLLLLNFNNMKRSYMNLQVAYQMKKALKSMFKLFVSEFNYEYEIHGHNPKCVGDLEKKHNKMFGEFMSVCPPFVKLK
jgi:hypothetical protein